jgi:hypothetical protein
LLLVLASAVISGSESSWTRYHISLSQIGNSQPEGPGSRFYILQEHGGPVIPPGTGFHFRSLLRLAELRWSYSNSPLHWVYNLMLG